MAVGLLQSECPTWSCPLQLSSRQYRYRDLYQRLLYRFNLQYIYIVYRNIDLLLSFRRFPVRY